MQIREQGRKIQCIRTVYDKAIGRGRQTVIATLARYTTEMPTTGLDELTEACLLYTSDAADEHRCRSRWSPYH